MPLLTALSLHTLGRVTTNAVLLGALACTRVGDARPTTSQPGEGAAADAPARDDAAAILAAFPDESDPAIRATRAALAMDAPWRATLAVAPALADPARRTTAAVLLAAAAAAAREDWATVSRLIGTAGATAPNAPDRDGGFGALLRARAALAQAAGAPPAARSTLARAAFAEASRSAAQTTDRAERGVRLTLAARALDRLAMGDATAAALADSTRQVYTAAAQALPGVADWLALRAAAVTRDATARGRALAAVRSPAARARTPWVEADARERAGDSVAAAVAYAGLGRRAHALALRLGHDGAAVRKAIRDSLVAIVGVQSGSGEARAAVELLDRSFGTLTPAEELAIGRSAAASGPAARAVAAFDRALAAGLGTQRDRYSHGALLLRVGRAREAASEFARVRAEGGALAGDAAYQRARALLRANDGSGARAALQEIGTAFPTDPAVTSARALLADLAVDDGNEAAARSLLRSIATQFPRSPRAPRAAFDAAIIALAAGDARTAATELDAIRAPGDTTPSEEMLAATYWAGRAWSAAGDPSRARDRWGEASAREPDSYYAMLANRRLDTPPWSPSEKSSASIAIPTAIIDATMDRIATLERLGFDPEAAFERDWLTRWADSSADRRVAVAEALAASGATSAGMRMARRALDGGATPSVALYRTLYPWPWQPLAREAASQSRGTDPALVAAVIRQESNFTPGAASPAGALGLMQIMPPVGRSLWGSMGSRADIPFTPTLLRQPDVNIALGVRHLASSLGQYPDPAFALAAYNAGGTPVARWRKRPGTSDPELFVERIPYDETRDYVRIVSRNAAFYRSLY